MPNFEQLNHIKSPESKEAVEVDSTFYPLVNEQLQKRYDRIATKWNSEAYDNTRRDDLIPAILEVATIEDGHQVLEAMCGTALLAQKTKVAHPHAKVYGLDFSIGMLNEVPTDIFCVQASVLGTPFGDEQFDRVLLRNAIYDLPKRMQRNALAEISRIMKNDGTFILQTYIADEDTKQALNEIANMKDRLAGQYQDMGKESPRYFATDEEFSQWFSRVGLEHVTTQKFFSDIKLQKASEMSDFAKQQFASFMVGLPGNTKEAINLRTDDAGGYTYSLPGVIYKITKNLNT